jgi:hypothetical protein
MSLFSISIGVAIGVLAVVIGEVIWVCTRKDDE